MKKKILILVCAISLITTVGAFATVNIVEEVKFNRMSKFDQMVAVMNENVEDDLEFNNSLINYKYLEKGYKVGAENMDYFADLIIDGYNAEEVMRCAYFWLDTDEDVAVVKKMCSWKDKSGRKGESEFWAENAFNAVTNNKCGVLTIEDFEEYTKKGITDADIMTANRLCRKGVYTIQEILKKFEEGMSMADIALEIEGQAPFSNHIGNTQSRINKSAKLQKVEDDEIFESRQLAMLKNVPEQVFYKEESDSVKIIDQLEDESRRVTDEIIKELNDGNYLRKRGENR